MIEFAEALSKVRGSVQNDLTSHVYTREKILATIVRLLELTHIRVGNEEYARSNHSYGLTTLANEHVDIEKGAMHFHFRGKSCKDWNIDVKDKMLSRIVKKSSELPGQRLFEYKDGDGNIHDVSSSDINHYIKESSGSDFTAKDFRTWAGTVLAVTALLRYDPEDSEPRRKSNVVQAIAEVSTALGNTPAVCRKCYIHPAVLQAYQDQILAALAQATGNIDSLSPEENATLSVLKNVG
jgi:DNA topoisomerase-1